MRFGIGTLTLILAMSTSWATAGETNSIRPDLMQQALADADRRDDGTANAAAPGFDEWKLKVEDARARRSHADTLILSGVGVGLATMVVGGIAASHSMAGMDACARQQQAALLATSPFSSTLPTLQTCSGSGSPGVVLGVGGALAIGLATVGAIHRHEAWEDLHFLNWQGQAKGYVSLGVTPQGDARVSCTLTF
jgi:hypothetical protein